MSDRTEVIERAINREIAGALSIRPHSGGMAAFTIAPASMADVMEFAKLMAVSGVCVRQPFRGNPGACLAVALQAMKWGADPFAVANKAFVVNDQISYESQLIHAIVNSSAQLAKRLDAVFDGEGTKRTCRVTGYIKGEDHPREYLSPEIGTIPVKNSPLWKSDPDQQLFYYSTRAWSRRWLPEVLLGIYTPEELIPTVELTAETVPAERREPQRMLSQLDRFEERHATQDNSASGEGPKRSGSPEAGRPPTGSAESHPVGTRPLSDPHSPAGISTHEPGKADALDGSGPALHAAPRQTPPAGDAIIPDLLGGEPRPAGGRYRATLPETANSDDWTAWERALWAMIEAGDPVKEIARDNRDNIEIFEQVDAIKHNRLARALGL